VAIANITTSYTKAIKEVGVLSSYMIDCATLDSKYQYFISEVVMLRLFSILETAIGDVALKLACGALYKNGNAPSRLVSCSSISDAHGKMLSHGRRHPLRYLKWTNLTDIRTSIQNILDIRDSFYVNIDSNISLIDEMRDVRNHIAHRNSGTAIKYYRQLAIIYGGRLRIPVGAFLNSTVRHTTSNINRYLLSVPIILDDITKG
jgi:hypothetical protein